MSVENCPLFGDFEPNCEPKDCQQCQIDDANWKHNRPADELPETDYYGG